jgi:ABC-type hemin transport system substrate-binding protein
MNLAQLGDRLRAAWSNVAAAINRRILIMALDALTALVATASAAADRLIAQAQGDAAKAADLQSQVNNLEQDAIAAVQPLADKLNQAAPEPPPAPPAA